MPNPGANSSEGPWARLAAALGIGRFAKWVLLSALIGLLGGLLAASFKWLVDQLISKVFRSVTGVTGDGIDVLDERAWLFVLIPALGGLITGWLVCRFAPETEGHGTDSVIRAFHRLRGVIRARVILLKALTSAITIGTGGSAGQEGPVAQMGAGLGSTLASTLKLTSRDRRLFLLSGASAAVGAIFCSPLGGALFMPEVLYRKSEFEGEAITPCIISSIFGYATFTTITGEERAVELAPALLESLNFDDPRQLLIYLVLGIACTLGSWLYTHTFYGIHGLFGRMRRVPRMWRPALGGALLGLLAISLAPFAHGSGVFFGGYGLIQDSFAGKIAIPALLALIVAKGLATSFTISSGGSGGVFAPSLAIGALLGAAIGQGADALFPGMQLEPACFVIVGMGGFFAGVAKVPITSVIMVSEMTGTYKLLAPLMLVSIVHVMLSDSWTMYRAQVKSLVHSPAHAGEFVVNVLESIRVRDVLPDARPPRVVHEDVTLRGAMKIVADSHETHFPVVNDEDQLVGIFSLTDLRRIFLQGIVEDFVIVRDFMIDRVVTVKMEDSLHEAQRKMTLANVNSLPVVDSENPRRVISLLERNAIGRAYNDKLSDLRGGQA